MVPLVQAKTTAVMTMAKTAIAARTRHMMRSGSRLGTQGIALLMKKRQPLHPDARAVRFHTKNLYKIGHIN